MRAERAYRIFRGVRAAALGLLFVCIAVGCGARNGPRDLALAYDRAEATGVYTWLVDHEPSAIVASEAPVGHLRDVVPNARLVIATLGADACAEAQRVRGALVTMPAGPSARATVDRALDCGVALFRDAHALVIAPR